jgi:hypothetical protein
VYDLKLTDYEKAEFLEAARLCGQWLVNCQNTPEKPWGGYHVKDSADCGRFLEKTNLCRDYRKPAGVWLTALYLAGLTDLLKAPVLDRGLYENAIDLGARYLKSLQCFDVRWPRAVGGFHEVVPGHDYSAPRDAASGSFGLVALYLHTGEHEYLDRAVRFAEWYSTHGSDADGYPWDDFCLATGEGTSRLRGDWQAGGALIYYQLWRLTRDDHWRDALEKVCDVLLAICANDPGTDTAYDFHGDCIISIGNDDFANTALFAGHAACGKQAYLDCAAERLRVELGRQAENGAFPNFGGTFVTALEMLEVLDLAAEGVIVLPPDEIVEPMMRAARFGLTLQDRTSPDRFVHGAVYGQANYATARDTVHGRDVVYAMQLWLRLAGYRAGAYTVLGWEPRG